MAPDLDIGSVYAEHGPFVARVIERLTGSGAHVDDLLQECFVAAFRGRGRYDESRAKVTTWLYSIAVNISKRHRRSRWRFSRLQERVAALDQPPDIVAPDERMTTEDNARLVHEVMQGLPFKQREVFALYELEGMEGPAIADLVGIPEGTVWTRLHHARKGFASLMRRRLLQEDLS